MRNDGVGQRRDAAEDDSFAGESLLFCETGNGEAPIMTLRNVVPWIIRILVLALAIKFAWWAYQNYWPDGQADSPPEVLDIDKECRVTPDTGQCFCRHRWTNERLSVPYRECVALARRP